jgi:hypothetical protein
MKARQTFFMRLGEQKLSDFREKYNVVLPRVVFLVDEFQQLFLEATTREQTKINDLLLSIVKLGRATGFHLLFASQEMSGALSGKALANFRIRFALPCESEVSAAILGNSAADSITTGQVYVNTGNGSAEQNRLFKVPYINSDADVSTLSEHPFYGVLMRLSDAQSKTGFAPKVPKFYDEDYREEIQTLETSLSEIKDIRKKYCSDPRYLDVITLGNGVVYSSKKNDLETFFIERGKNKNIAVISSRMTDLAYVQKLLTTNFKMSPASYMHRIYSFDPMVRKTYDFTTDLDGNYSEYKDAEALTSIKSTYELRRVVKVASNQAANPADFAKRYFLLYGQQLKEGIKERDKHKVLDEQIKAYVDFWVQELDGLEDADVLDFIETVDKSVDKQQGDLLAKLKMYIKLRADEDPFTQTIYWMNGLDGIDAVPKWMAEVMKNGSDYGMLFVMMSNTLDDNFIKLLPTCDYIFVGGNVERFYDRCGVPYTRKSDDSIVIDFKIRSLNTVRSFKMYRNLNFDESPAPFIDFDSILGD